jgi:serine phosphatase RsbU (regulator of sigma subunit)/catechol 2,3-dioxygenase-like lactoylglutathione lyase family enzyme
MIFAKSSSFIRTILGPKNSSKPFPNPNKPGFLRPPNPPAPFRLIISPMGNSPIERTSDSTVRLDRQDPYLRLQSVTIYVRDLEKSLSFYLDQLGFELVFDARIQPDRRFVTVAPPDGTANLTLVAPEPGSEQSKLIGRPTPVTFVTEDVLAKYREWTERGVRFQFAPRLKRLKYEVQVRASQSVEPSVPRAEHAPIWGGVFTRFKDADGNSFLLVSFDEVTQAVEAQRRGLAERLESERRAAQEIEIAKQVQARLFPQTLPPLKTLEYAGLCIQARKVGGDYYDFLDLGSERLGFVVGDISGKGIAAALLMANLQANVRSQCAIALDQLQRLMCSVNQLFCDNTPDGSFATFFFAEYDDTSGRLRYANCGHLPGLLLRSDNSVQRLDATATVLGIFKDWDCEIGECQVYPGDTLALYTDGITETYDSADDQFGEQRLIDSLQRHRQSSSQSALAAIVDEVRRFGPHEQHDDITLIVAKHVGG